MKKVIFAFILVMVLLALAVNSWAFMYDNLKIRTRAEISRLSDEELTETYIEAQVEYQAANTFHQRAGVTPKDYDKFKALLRYRADLLIELQKRKLEIPKTEP